MATQATQLHPPEEALKGAYGAQIVEALLSPDFRPVEVFRLILLEMSLACQELRQAGEHSSLQFRLKPLLAQVQALRTLAQTVSCTNDFQVESDVLDLGGPKFRYVLNRIYDVFVKSISEANCDALTAQTIIRLTADNLGREAADIRQKVKTLRAPSEPSFAWPQSNSRPNVANAGDWQASEPQSGRS